jgi:ABC-type phosphate transport system substrate-binding protein
VRRHIIPVLAAFILSATAHSAATAEAVRVIVHPQVKGTQVPRAVLSSIFLRQAKHWGDGSPVVPVDQSVQSPVRRLFCSRMLGQPLMDVQVYWQRKLSSGVMPPPVKTSDDEVIAFVAATPGAIGYVSPDANVPQTVKTIEVTN